jgi:FeS assembly SUF system regulator
MIRMTRLADYGIVLLAHFARDGEDEVRSARDIAIESHVPAPTVSKVLKLLARKGLLEAHRGVNGGFKLARRPDQITLAEIVAAFEGAIALTDCASGPAGQCGLERLCPARTTIRRVNELVRDTLRQVTLADVSGPRVPATFSL